MRSGWKASEFWLAAKWSLVAISAVASLLAFLPDSWPLALAVSGPVMVLVYMAGVQANNYGENRFRLKAQAAQQGAAMPQGNPPSTQAEHGEPAGRIGFETPNEEEQS